MFDISRVVVLAFSISLMVFFAACGHAVPLSWDPSADWGALPDAHDASLLVFGPIIRSRARPD